MSASRRVAVGTAWQVAGRAALAVIGLASVALVTRYLGPTRYGQMGLALAYTQIFGVLADAGLATTVVRELSRAPDSTEPTMRTALRIRLVLAAVAFALAALVSLALPYSPSVRIAIVIAGAAMAFGLLNSAYVALFTARLRMGWTVTAQVVGRIATFAGAALVAGLDLGFYPMVGTVVVGAVVNLVLTRRFAGRLADLGRSGPRVPWRPLLRASLVLGIALAVTELYFRADTFIISLSRTYREVGLYSLAYRILELVATVPGAFLTLVFPVIAARLARGQGEARGAVQRAADAFTLFGLGIAAGGAVLAPAVVTFAAGDDFAGAAAPLRILLFAGALAALNGLFGYALIAAGRQRDTLWLNVSGLVLNVALNVILVPTYGIVAAAWVTLGTEVLILAGSFVLMRRRLGFFPGFAIGLRAAPVAAIMALVLWPLRHGPAVPLVLLGGVLYAGGLFAVRAIDRDTLRRLRA